MSDISLQFTWLDLLLFALVIGSPGLFLGAGLGALAWDRHRFYGAVLGGLVGLGACLGLEFLSR
jgi:hypothetical protein